MFGTVLGISMNEVMPPATAAADSKLFHLMCKTRLTKVNLIVNSTRHGIKPSPAISSTLCFTFIEGQFFNDAIAQKNVETNCALFVNKGCIMDDSLHQ